MNDIVAHIWTSLKKLNIINLSLELNIPVIRYVHSCGSLGLYDSLKHEIYIRSDGYNITQIENEILNYIRLVDNVRETYLNNTILLKKLIGITADAIYINP
jgi:hypothetical protein